MSEVPSTFLLKAGDTAPDFEAFEPAQNSSVQFSELRPVAGPTLIVFACNHCPYVVHLAERLGEIAREYKDRVNCIAISSNDVENYPQDAPEKMVSFQAQYGWDFPYLYDESQEIARAYSAACTPDFFLFDENNKLIWAGEFDSTRPRGRNQGEATGEGLIAALDAALEGRQLPEPWKPATGCNIKWKAGNEPQYFSA